MNTEVWLFGNPDLPQDSLPLRLVPALRKKFPDIEFDVKDPNEEWDVPEHLIVIDSIAGIDRVQQFDGLDAFQRSPRVSLHDFDALANLRLLQKLGKLKQVTVIGVPPLLSKNITLVAVIRKLESLLKNRNHENER